MNILLKQGQRGIIVGQTGSGKTTGAIWLLQHIPVAPVIILDTKGEPAFESIARPAQNEGDEDERLEIIEGGDAFLKRYNTKRSELPEYFIVRPTPEEIAEPLIMDGILTGIYNAGRACLIYIDEAYQWHINGRAGSGLIGLLTRGRSKGMTTLISSQRPAWISRFCFSESQKFYVYRIQDKRDIKTINEFIPDFIEKKIPEKFYFWYYDIDMEKVKLCSPVPMPEKKGESERKQKHSWV